MNKISISIQGEAKEIAALVLALQEQQSPIINQLMLDTINNAPVVQDYGIRQTAVTSDSPVNIDSAAAAD